VTPWRRLLFAVAMLIPGTADAQEAAGPAKERERISFVYFAPDRLGLLIPLNDRWMVRPDFTGNSFHTAEPRDYVFHEVGVSLIRRSESSARGWAYGVARYSFGNVSGSIFEDPYIIHALSLAVGGHGQVIDWLGAFGEVGPWFNYHQDDAAIGGGTRIITQGGLSTRIGVTLRRPAKDAATRPSAERAPATEEERPAWVFSGFSGFDRYSRFDGAGVLIPLTGTWLLRPDVAVSATAFRPGETDMTGVLGLSLLRRSTPSEHGWVYSALRYGVTYDQYYSGEPDIAHMASLTLGAHVRLTDRLGAFAEAGPYVRFWDQETSSGTFDARNVGFIHGVGLSYSWKARSR
jgi:hypothetical protein